MADSLAPTERHAFEYQGRTIYEWDQTLSEVNLYISVPPGVRAKDLYVDLQPTHVRLGVKPNPPYIDQELAGRIKVSESFWTLDDGGLQLQLCKATKGEPWQSALVGHSINPVAQEEERKRLMLERFQMEHPGFDFSGAEFTGSAPDAHKFLGGMSTQ